jgi:acetylornithine deacetylase/succinyl-diaminopimelate desuccinylase-like protein
VKDLVPAVQAWLEPRAEEMAALVAELVAVDTENPPGRGLGACGRLLHDAAEGLGVRSEVIELPPSGSLEEPCVVRGRVGDGARTVYFHGHFDVVPAQGPGQFRPRREGGRIVGRGTADMKGGLVSMLYGAAAAAELGFLGSGGVVLHFVCDEETGSVAGSGHLRAAGLIEPGAVAMVTAEPTGGVVWHASRGAITLRVVVAGREAHTGQAHRGVNAFDGVIAVAAPLGKLALWLRDERRTAYRVDGDDDEAARGSMLVVGGTAGSGAGFNVVPGEAWFSVDRRLNPEEKLEEELARLRDTIADAARETRADVTVEVLQQAPSAGTDETHPVCVALADCVAAVEGARPAFRLCPGVLETRWYAQLGIPALAYGPGGLDVSHGPEEYVDEAALRRCAAVYALFAGDLLR